MKVILPYLDRWAGSSNQTMVDLRVVTAKPPAMINRFLPSSSSRK
jgi:hypothetical protein